MAASSGASQSAGFGRCPGVVDRLRLASAASSGATRDSTSGSRALWSPAKSRIARRPNLYASLWSVASSSPAGTCQSAVSTAVITDRPRTRIASQSMKKHRGRELRLNRRLLGDRSPTAICSPWNSSSVSAVSRRNSSRNRSCTGSSRAARYWSLLSRNCTWPSASRYPAGQRMRGLNSPAMRRIRNPVTVECSSTTAAGHAARSHRSRPTAYGSASRYPTIASSAPMSSVARVAVLYAL